MLKIGFILLFFVIFNIHEVSAFPSTSGTCVVDENLTSITGMTLRGRNSSSGPYSVTSNEPVYHNLPVEITITADSINDKFIGIMFTVVDELGNNVGTFAPEGNIVHECSGVNQTNPPAAAVTHNSSFGEMTSYTLFWIPPIMNVGKVYVLGYILRGSSGLSNTQEFYRFVREDSSAISLNARDIFTSSFE